MLAAMCCGKLAEARATCQTDRAPGRSPGGKGTRLWLLTPGDLASLALFPAGLAHQRELFQAAVAIQAPSTRCAPSAALAGPFDSAAWQRLVVADCYGRRQPAHSSLPQSQNGGSGAATPGRWA